MKGGVGKIPDYQKMYYAVCAGVSDALDRIPEGGPFREIKRRLTEALLEAEEIYIQTADFQDEKSENEKPAARGKK